MTGSDVARWRSLDCTGIGDKEKAFEIHTRRLALRIFNHLYTDNCILVYIIPAVIWLHKRL